MTATFDDKSLAHACRWAVSECAIGLVLANPELVGLRYAATAEDVI
jgi:hypothetical protein